MIEKIKKWFINILAYLYFDVFLFGMIKYKYLKEYKNKVFIDYIEKKVLELANNENIKIFFVTFDEINKDENVIENDKTVGQFIYFENRKIRIQQEISKLYGTELKKIKDDIIPRIEISEKGDVFTTIHELGHYFIYKKNQTQTEASADMFIEEFFNIYLPSFFKWIYQIEIEIRTKKEIKFTSLECYNYWKEYQKFIKKYNGIQ